MRDQSPSPSPGRASDTREHAIRQLGTRPRRRPAFASMMRLLERRSPVHLARYTGWDSNTVDFSAKIPPPLQSRNTTLKGRARVGLNLASIIEGQCARSAVLVLESSAQLKRGKDACGQRGTAERPRWSSDEVRPPTGCTLFGRRKTDRGRGVAANRRVRADGPLLRAEWPPPPARRQARFRPPLRLEWRLWPACCSPAQSRTTPISTR